MFVVIVGVGIFGLFIVWVLIKKGVFVMLFEQGLIFNLFSVLGDQYWIIWCVYGGQGGYQCWIGDVYVVWEVMWVDFGEICFVDIGFMLLFQEDGDGGDIYWKGLIEGGYLFEDLSVVEIVDCYLFIDFVMICWGVVSVEGGVLFCQKIVVGLCDWLCVNGVDVCENMFVIVVDFVVGLVIFVDGVFLSGDYVIVIVGVWMLGFFLKFDVSFIIYWIVVVYLMLLEDLKDVWQ